MIAGRHALDDTDQHVCARCRTPWGVSGIPCPNDVAARQIATKALTDAEQLRAHLADQNRFWRAHTRDTAQPDWSDLTPDEQLLIDEDRYLTENGGLAFYEETENN